MKDEDLDVLMEKTIGGDPQARDELWLALAPRIEKIAGQRGVTGPLAGLVDERRDIVTTVMVELYADGCALVRDLLACLRRRDRSFERKLATIARHTAIDHVRAHAEYGAGPASSGWARHVALPDLLDEDCPDAVRKMMVDEILAYAEAHLPPKQYEALMRWAAGERKEEIAEALGLANADAATRLVRAAQWRLRNRFAPTSGEGFDP